ncbi:3-dehydroquinate synthase [Spirochaetia bacterium]|nr:3-dehydroquinate synthase [Spirochaetia bacterium]
MDYNFTFDQTDSRVRIQPELPRIDEILRDADITADSKGFKPCLLVCDRNTERIACDIASQGEDRRITPICTLPAGEEHKTWQSVERILRTAREHGLGRDGLFIGIGGGVITDMTAFAASVYMRGAKLSLVSTTLLGMVDAAVGGKTGFDLAGMKNLAGTFFPASHVYMPLDALHTLPPGEWKSGMAELVKTAILDSRETLEQVQALEPFMRDVFGNRRIADGAHPALLAELIERAVRVKGRIVEADPRETSNHGAGSKRALLNLGHTFGHALESAAGLGTLTHGEAVAWGMARASELGLALGITPESRAREITGLIKRLGYETAAPHPALADTALFMQALAGDKKKKAGTLTFVVPAGNGAELVSAASIAPGLLERIITGK